MVTVTEPDARARRAHEALAAVTDPELPDLSIEELGILREVTDVDGTVVVTVTPTFSGCPAMAEILSSMDRVLAAAGVAPYRIDSRLSPAWRSTWITPAGRDKLHRAGIAPPAGEPPAGPVDLVLGRRARSVCCPRCGAETTELLSEFGATACRSLWRCVACREPFDTIKAV